MILLLQLGPFVLLLLAIALLPLVAERFWHPNRTKALVSLALALPCVVWLLAQGPAGVHRLLHALGEYLQFILLLAALYAISGVLVVHGDLPRGPVGNTLWLALGAVLANLIGTTGASMLLLRPLLCANHHRRRNRHVPLFFIFVVGNCGGLLLPLGDPPLFLGFLEGVDFFWTLQLWPHWLVVNGLVLLIFYAWDARAWRADCLHPAAPTATPRHPLRIEGLGLGTVLVLGVMATLLLQAPSIARALGQELRRVHANIPDPLLPAWAGGVILAVLTGLAAAAIHRTPRETRVLVWEPMLEVAILFAGIFITMTPALHLLSGLPPLPWTEAPAVDGRGHVEHVGQRANLSRLRHVGQPGRPAPLAEQPRMLQALSCGAVWMGALTYIGNGPNFLIRSIAEHMGYRMPSFFGYLGYSLPILLPVFALATLLFFR